MKTFGTVNGYFCVRLPAFTRRRPFVLTGKYPLWYTFTFVCVSDSAQHKELIMKKYYYVLRVYLDIWYIYSVLCVKFMLDIVIQRYIIIVS